MTVEIDEAERQLVLLALALASLARPGFDHALNNIAILFDGSEGGRSKLYDEFRRLNADRLTAASRAE